MFESASAHATIAVSDIDRAKTFYGEILGLPKKEERSGGVTYAAGAGSWFLVYPTQFAGTAQSTAMTFETANLDAAVAELAERGVTFEQYDVPGLRTDERGIAQIEGERAAWFKDPDGNILAIGQRT